MAHCAGGADVAHPCPEPVEYRAAWTFGDGSEQRHLVCREHAKAWRRDGWRVTLLEGAVSSEQGRML